MKYQIPLLVSFFVGLIASFGLLYFLVLPQESDGPQVADNAEEPLQAEEVPVNPSLSSPPEDSIHPTADWTELFHPRYLMGRFTQEEHPDMVKVPTELTDGDGTYYLHRQALDSFKVMHAAAAADSVALEIVSAFRNFDRQKAIWEAKWNGQRLLEGTEDASVVYPDPAERATAILRYSSMPGSSRHHWGTDLDLNNLNNSYFASGPGLQVYEWLQANAAAYGFCQPYTAKGTDRPHGYEEEKWHWSFMPLSTPLTVYAEQYLRDTMIQGFAGAESAPMIGVVEKYVLGISPDCR